MTRTTMVWVTAAALLGTGCELAAPLIAAELGGGDDSVDLGTAALSVQIESAEGSVGGQELSPGMLTAVGDRFGEQLQFRVEVGTPDTTMFVTVPQADGSAQNPYVGDFEEGLPPDEPRPDFPGDAGTGLFVNQGLAPEPAAHFMLCDASECLEADDFDIQIEQTEAGRVASFEGAFGRGQSVQLVMRYTEDG